MSRHPVGARSRRQQEQSDSTIVHDPLRLCVFTTVALLTWLIGPVVVAGLAALGFAGYLRARRAGRTSSRCILRDTRLVLVYLGAVGLVALAGVIRQVVALVG